MNKSWKAPPAADGLRPGVRVPAGSAASQKGEKRKENPKTPTPWGREEGLLGEVLAALGLLVLLLLAGWYIARGF